MTKITLEQLDSANKSPEFIAMIEGHIDAIRKMLERLPGIRDSLEEAVVASINGVIYGVENKLKDVRDSMRDALGKTEETKDE